MSAPTHPELSRFLGLAEVMLAAGLLASSFVGCTAESANPPSGGRGGSNITGSGGTDSTGGAGANAGKGGSTGGSGGGAGASTGSGGAGGNAGAGGSSGSGGVAGTSGGAGKGGTTGTGGGAAGTSGGGASGAGAGGNTGGGAGTGGSAGAPDAGSAGKGGGAVDAGSGGSAGRPEGGASDARPVDGGRDGANPLTDGWTLKPFTFAIHSPYDLPESDRHSFDSATDTHTFWILDGDSPHQPPPNTTGARSELRMQNDYTSGDHQFEADFYVVADTVGPTIMQVFGGSPNATAAMFKVHAGGVLKHYDNATVKTNIYDTWFHLNVIHHALPDGTGQIQIYIDNQLAGTFDDNTTATHYFKCGVYNITSARAESRFRNIKYWVR